MTKDARALCRPAFRPVSTGALTALLASALLSACASEEAPKAPGTGGNIPAVGTGGSTGMGGNPGGSDAPNRAADPASDAAPGRADLAAGETDGTDGAVAMATGGATASGTGGSSVPGSGGVGGTMDAGDRDAPMSGEAGGAHGDASDPTLDGAVDTGGTLDDSCNPPPPNGYHTVHFRYPWAGQKTLTLFPRPELMPATIELKVDALCNSVTCTREQNRPWFSCPSTRSCSSPAISPIPWPCRPGRRPLTGPA